jgi:hypothetical protein
MSIPNERSAPNPIEGGSGEYHDETNRNPRSAHRALEFKRGGHLVEQPAIDRCLWAKEKDVALSCVASRGFAAAADDLTK